ncbi:hypothetical protein ALC53_14184 [Atta colombica]|uniref:Uncharacterized protein n=1 Tax=Atta colombica TaxID=520822 RepID=A0A195ATD9_9HYME|nr:hypothetical protein ALC53_14184 [Atta colombica]
MLRSQTHDKGRESKGEFTRCVYRIVLEESLVHQEAVPVSPSWSLNSSRPLVAKTIPFYWHAALNELQDRWKLVPRILEEKDYTLNFLQ